MKIDKNNRGFTLVELMVTVAIAAILLAIAAPSFVSLSSSNAAESAATRLVDSLAYARSEAITRSANVTVCSKTQGANTCSNANSWVNGWLIYIEGEFTTGDADAVDLDGEGAGNEDDLLLRVENVGGLNLDASQLATAASLSFNNLGEEATGNTFDIFFAGVAGESNGGVDVSISAQGASSAVARSVSYGSGSSDDSSSSGSSSDSSSEITGSEEGG